LSLPRAAFDVIVVGAGPSGSTVAMDLVQKGHKVLLVDKDTHPGEKNVCGGLMPENYASGLSIPSWAIERRLEAFRYHIDNKTYSMTLPAISFHRRVFDRYLAETAARLGAQLATDTFARGVTIGNEVVASLVDKQGRLDTAESKLIVFADGPHTLANRTMGIGFDRHPTNTAIAAIYEVDSGNFSLEAFEHFVNSEVSPCGYGWIFPKRSVLNVGIYCLMSKIGNRNIHCMLDWFIEEFKPVARYLADRPRARFATALIPLTPAIKLFAHRTLVVGDAAGMVEPVWGDGIGFGIMGGHLAAEVAHKSLEFGRYDEAFLSEYQKQWEKSVEYRTIKRYSRLLRLMLTVIPERNNPFEWTTRVALRSYALYGLKVRRGPDADLCLQS